MNIKSREDNGPYGFFVEAETTVEFYDCDPMQVVWNGNYLNYFEIGRRVLIEKIGYTYTELEEFGYIFPIVEISAKYLIPLRHRDHARIKAILTEYENRIKIKYEIRNIKTGILTTRGFSTQMAYNIKTGDSCFVCPQFLIDKIEAHIGGNEL